MIPTIVEEHLRKAHQGYEIHPHPVATSAQELAAREHVSGYRVAKPVAVLLDGRLAIAVVSAVERLRLGVLEEATGAQHAELVSEVELLAPFSPCDPGAEPPLALFGVPIFVDAKLAQADRIVMPGGTYRDAIILDTAEWMRCEQVQEVPNLGALTWGESP